MSMQGDKVNREQAEGGFSVHREPLAYADIRPWRELYDADCEDSETGFSRWNSESYMQDEIDELRAAFEKMAADFEATVEYMNEGCVCGRAPSPKLPVDPRLLKPVKKKP